jgi:hypothetical protein
MDPYLESPDWFPGLHGSLIILIKALLQKSLPETYYADSSQRVWLEYSHRHVEPDVEVVRSGSKPRARKAGRAGVAVAVRQTAEPLVLSVETIEHGPFHESFVEVRRRKGKDVRLVTSIEVLSLSNKTRGNPGREKYLEKQREVLDGQVHLVEIDLLRGGTHTSAVPRDLARAKAGPFDYHVSIRRFDRPKEFFFYPIELPQRFPKIAIPLLPGDPDVMLDLQAAFDQAYEFGPYRKEVDYGEDPIIPAMRPERQEWAKALLKTKR